MWDKWQWVGKRAWETRWVGKSRHVRARAIRETTAASQSGEVKVRSVSYFFSAVTFKVSGTGDFDMNRLVTKQSRRLYSLSLAGILTSSTFHGLCQVFVMYSLQRQACVFGGFGGWFEQYIR
jgi:hypothetical protein